MQGPMIPCDIWQTSAAAWFAVGFWLFLATEEQLHQVTPNMVTWSAASRCLDSIKRPETCRTKTL